MIRRQLSQAIFIETGSLLIHEVLESIKIYEAVQYVERLVMRLGRFGQVFVDIWRLLLKLEERHHLAEDLDVFEAVVGLAVYVF